MDAPEQRSSFPETKSPETDESPQTKTPRASLRRTVGDLMTAPAITAKPDETLAEAARRMRQFRVGSLVVADAVGPVGILTERDLLMAIGAGASVERESVADFMTTPVETVDVHAEARGALDRLRDRGYRHIPVIAAGNLVGVVSMRDLMTVAQITPPPGGLIDVPPGLKGVAVTHTGIGDVRGLEGFYHYRQYLAIELARHCGFEEVTQARRDDLRQRGVLRGRRDGPVRPSPTHVQSHVRVEPGGRLVRPHPRAGREQQDHPSECELRGAHPTPAGSTARGALAGC